MVPRYMSGDSVQLGDRIRYGGTNGVVELVADPDISSPETAWYVEQYGSGCPDPDRCLRPRLSSNARRRRRLGAHITRPAMKASNEQQSRRRPQGIAEKGESASARRDCSSTRRPARKSGSRFTAMTLESSAIAFERRGGYVNGRAVSDRGRTGRFWGFQRLCGRVACLCSGSDRQAGSLPFCKPLKSHRERGTTRAADATGTTGDKHTFKLRRIKC
jgi:hypothetical protein